MDIKVGMDREVQTFLGSGRTPEQIKTIEWVTSLANFSYFEENPEGKDEPCSFALKWRNTNGQLTTMFIHLDGKFEVKEPLIRKYRTKDEPKYYWENY